MYLALIVLSLLSLIVIGFLGRKKVIISFSIIRRTFNHELLFNFMVCALYYIVNYYCLFLIMIHGSSLLNSPILFVYILLSLTLRFTRGIVINNMFNNRFKIFRLIPFFSLFHFFYEFWNTFIDIAIKGPCLLPLTDYSNSDINHAKSSYDNALNKLAEGKCTSTLIEEKSSIYLNRLKKRIIHHSTALINNESPRYILDAYQKKLWDDCIVWGKVSQVRENLGLQSISYL